MSPTVLVDTGPLVALFNTQDRFHEWASVEFRNLKSPAFTCESVLSEAFFVLGHGTQRARAFKESLSRGWIKCEFHLDAQMAGVLNLMKRYENIPMSLADASLVRLSEMMSDSAIFTLDCDFHIYRKHKRQIIPLIIPPEI